MDGNWCDVISTRSLVCAYVCGYIAWTPVFFFSILMNAVGGHRDGGNKHICFPLSCVFFHQSNTFGGDQQTILSMACTYVEFGNGHNKWRDFSSFIVLFNINSSINDFDSAILCFTAHFILYSLLQQINHMERTSTHILMLILLLPM